MGISTSLLLSMILSEVNSLRTNLKEASLAFSFVIVLVRSSFSSVLTKSIKTYEILSNVHTSILIVLCVRPPPECHSSVWNRLVFGHKFIL